MSNDKELTVDKSYMERLVDGVNLGDTIIMIKFKMANNNIANLNDLLREFVNIQKYYNSTQFKKYKNNFVIGVYKYSKKYIKVNFNNQNTQNSDTNDIKFNDYFEKTKICSVNKHIILTLIYNENFSEGQFENMHDSINFQYLLLNLQYLKNKNLTYRVFIKNEDDNSNNLAISYGIQTKIRAALRFYYMYEEKIVRNIYVYSNYNRDKATKIQWQKLILKIGKTDMSYKIFPVIPINSYIMETLNNKLVIDDNGTIKDNNEIDQLIQRYDDEVIKLLSKYKEDVDELNKYKKTDNKLEYLIFIYTLFYLITDLHSNSLSEEDILIIVHEKCIDYAQGVMQLIENSLYHTIQDETGKMNEGIGCFSIRVRNMKEENKNIAKNYFNLSRNSNEINLDRFKYIMEIYVTDLKIDTSKFAGIVAMFKKNHGNKNNLGKVYKFDNLTLPEIFGKFDKSNSELNEFYEDASNIAYHYGLQILNNVIKVGNGYLFVKSGDGNLNCFSNTTGYDVEKNEIIEKRYKGVNFDWKYGTAYIIYLPIDISIKNINYTDTLAVQLIANTKSNEADKIIIESIPNIEDALKSVENKHKAVDKIKEYIREKINNKINDNTILVINCIEIDDNRYEILAKAVFECLASKDFNINNIALINIENIYIVVKMFRQFALFYNRQGNNSFMQEKSVFMVDRDAKVDIILKGRIEEIAEGLVQNQIYGGMDGKTMMIIKCLMGSRGNE